MKSDKLITVILWTIVAVLALLPPLAWMAVTSGPKISPDDTLKRLSSPDGAWALVDVRSSEDFAAGHIPGAISIPYPVLSHDPRESWRKPLEGKTFIMVVCRVGVSSARAVAILRKNGFPQTVSVAGGMDAWLQMGKKGVCAVQPGGNPPGGAPGLVPEQVFTLLEQFIISIAAFGIKPLYEIMALALVIILWQSTDPGARTLRWSMAAFFLGENACAVNFLFYNDRSLMWEYLHSSGMLIAFAFFFYASMEAVDHQLIRFSSPEDRCALLPVCKLCYKHQNVRCYLYRLFVFVPLAAAAVALMPLTAKLGIRYARGAVFGSETIFGQTFPQQMFEVRYCPVIAILFFLAAWGVLIFEKEKGFGRSKILLAMGMGPLSFGFMRFLIYWAYSPNPLWADFWEEATELIFIAFLVWLILGTDHFKTIWRRLATPAPAPPET